MTFQPLPGTITFRFNYFDYKKRISFQVDGISWSYDLASYDCSHQETDGPVRLDGFKSPNGKRVAFTSDHNFWVLEAASGEERQLTHGGESRYGYPYEAYLHRISLGGGEPELLTPGVITRLAFLRQASISLKFARASLSLHYHGY